MSTANLKPSQPKPLFLSLGLTLLVAACSPEPQQDEKRQDAHAAHAPEAASESEHAGMDHSTMDHGTMHPPATGATPTDHAAMGHTPQDHAAMGHAPSPTTPVDHAAMGHAPAATPTDHSAMDPAAMGHAPAVSASASAKPGATAHAGHGTAAKPTDHSATGHAGHGAADKPTDHSAADHAGHGAAAKPTDHSAMDHAAMGHPPAFEASTDHGAMDHAAMGHAPRKPGTSTPRTPIPVVTDADRAAAFPRVAGHAAHDDKVHSYWEIDHLEVWNADPGTGLGWEAAGWIGRDTRRVWIRSEGEHVDGDLEGASVEVLAGKSITPWWDVVAGVRHDVGEGPSQTFLAVGVQGLAPQKFEVEATAYVGTGGQTAARVEAEYDTLLTNRLVLQWNAEANVHGQSDPARGVGSGLSTIEVGARLRYEVTRKVAPYIGVVRERAFGNTADIRREEGASVDDTRVVAGVRIWF